MELRLDGWRSGLRFAAAHIVPGHPKCGQLHGHTYAVHCVLEGDVPPSGMIMDFGIIKTILRELTEVLDHQFIVPADHPDLVLEESDGETEVRIGGSRIVVPTKDVALVPLLTGTVEHIADWFLQELLDRKVLPENVSRIGIGIDEGYGKGAWAYADL